VVDNVDLFDPPLGDNQGTVIGKVGSGHAALVHVVIAENSRAVVTAKRQMEATIGKDLVDYAQIVEHF
jgi:hypothetical protein